MRTTRTDAAPNNIDLDFHDGFVPIPQLFPEAPPGVYSSVEIRVGDSRLASAAIDVLGRAARGGNLIPFEIKSELLDVPISVVVNTELLPRVIATTTIELDVERLVKDIDWDDVALTGEGVLFIGDGDPEMSSVLSNVATAFSAAQ
jgi:hypothetical protein